MLRLETETGWWLVTHPDHARLAGEFAAQWGNGLFAPPEPRTHVLKGIAKHDDGWAARDAAPKVTRQGKPSAFGVELVGKYAAFEEIDLEDYLAVRERAVNLMAAEDAYAALLVSMHTYNLLAERADRSTIAKEQLPLLDGFLGRQNNCQDELRRQIAGNGLISEAEQTGAAILDQFRLLQATDNLSLLSCVDYRKPANLLHPLRLRNGDSTRVEVRTAAERRFVLAPYPFKERTMEFAFPARHVEGKGFSSAAELAAAFSAAEIEMLRVTVSAEE